jgi:hypothetical protein
MSLEEVLSGYDSEAEVDDEVLDIEDRWVCKIICDLLF